jgi:arylsulfatase A-like enzyme
MNKKSSSFNFALLVLFSFACFCQCSHNESQQKKSKLINRKPNIVLIVADDLGYTDLSVMGSSFYESPNIDRLAKEGMIFNNGYASAANCAPSRACMLSGRQTPHHGVYTVSPSARGDEKTRQLIPIKNTPFLDTSVYTLPKMLQNAGYVTGSFGKWHVGMDPRQQGIDVNVGGSKHGNPGRNGYYSPYKISFIEDGPEGEYLTDRLTSEALSFIESNQENPFFLYVPYYTVHTPIIGKPGLVEKFNNKESNKNHNHPEYAAMVASLDENVGRILDKIETLNLEENTLIIFTSDNGGLHSVSQQLPLRAGKGSYYEGGIKVPLIIKWKGQIAPGSSCDKRVSNLDFYPTMQSITQPPIINKDLDGTDILPLLKGKNNDHPPLVYHFPVYLQSSGTIQGLSDPLFRTRPGRVIIDGDWKLHHYFEDDRKELYNLEKDVSETYNVIEKYPEVAEKLYAQLENWRVEKKAPIPTERNLEYDPGEEKLLAKKKVAQAKMK